MFLIIVNSIYSPPKEKEIKYGNTDLFFYTPTPNIFFFLAFHPFLSVKFPSL